MLPVQNRCIISKLYGEPPPKGYTYSAGKHAGVDFASVPNNLSSNIYATTDGTIYKVNYDGHGWGCYIVLLDKNGLYHIYCHLQSLTVINRYVRNNSINIKKGEIIGYMGSTGKSTGNHLHYEIRRNYFDKYDTIDPCDYLGIVKERGPIRMNNTPSEWAKEAWEEMTKKKFIDGTNPQSYLTREEMAVILQRVVNYIDNK